MFSLVSIFVSLVAIAVCDYQTDEYVKNILYSEVDKDCIEKHVSLFKYINLALKLDTCTTDLILGKDEVSFEGDEIEDYCENNDESSLCSKILAENLEPCLSYSQKTNLKYDIDSAIAVKDYSCANNGKVLRELLDTDRKRCFRKKAKDEAEKCEELLYPLHDKYVNDLYKEEACLEREKYWQCKADVVRACSGDVAYTLVVDQNDARLRATPCEKFISTPDKSHAPFGLNGSVLVILFCYGTLGYSSDLIFIL